MAAVPKKRTSEVFEITTERTGETRIVAGRDCDFILQDALRTWSDGTQDVLSGYYRSQTNFRCGDGDYCFYCGAFNGPHGEDRQGFDCAQCGSN